MIKSALAAIVANYAAELLGIHSPANTGLLAILGVEVPRRRGIRSALNRITASVFALGAGSAIILDEFKMLGIGLGTIYPKGSPKLEENASASALSLAQDLIHQFFCRY
ncbi:aromatic acid exporter family protein [Paenibacillus dendrobii]|uniref:aromatic acid exporter family protein n=1 Tax=Paenibacillus dendrobii TaxID=2691084 RepID=UPI003C6E67D3